MIEVSMYEEIIERIKDPIVIVFDDWLKIFSRAVFSKVYYVFIYSIYTKILKIIKTFFLFIKKLYNV